MDKTAPLKELLAEALTDAEQRLLKWDVSSWFWTNTCGYL